LMELRVGGCEGVPLLLFEQVADHSPFHQSNIHGQVIICE
jgi:hypothetical protein